LINDNIWGIGNNTPNRKNIQKEDQVLFYKTQPNGRKFIGKAILNSSTIPFNGDLKYSEDSNIIVKGWDNLVLLKEIEVFEEPILIEPLFDFLDFIKDKSKWGTYLQGGVVKITKKDFETILLGSTRNILTEEIDFSEYPEGVDEGSKKMVQHYARERNPKIIQLIKEKAIREKGSLKCEICGFSFYDKYGERGKDYIEGHHKKPISKMKLGEKTFIEDITLLCSNCHKMIHRKMDDFSVEDLKKIIN